MAEAMLPAELAEVTDPLEPADELLTADELASLSLFESLKKTPSFQRFPGTTVLRRCQKGRVLVRQGEAGATAFSILTTEDVIELRENQLQAIRDSLESREANQGPGSHQYYAAESPRALKKLATQFESELEELRQRAAAGHSDDTPETRSVATAHLVLGSDEKRRPGLLHRLRWLFGGTKRSGRASPDFIPIDGPADISAATRQAPLHEGELFGEMSCMNRAPRSATVIVDRDCYMLELLRNVLDMLNNDPTYRQKIDDVYRERVLNGHIRRMSIFRDLSDAGFAALKDRIELVNHEAGSVIFEEHEDSDSFYVVRSGLVKVVRNAWTLLRETEFEAVHWTNIWKELNDASQSEAGSALVDALPESLIEAAREDAAGLEQQRLLIESFNDLIRDGSLHTKFGKTTEDIVLAVDHPQIEVDCEHFPEDTKNWSELERRTFHRSLLEVLLPRGMPRRAASSGARRILRYMGRGEGFGELGVMTRAPRSATIFAYDHPDGGSHQRMPDSRTGAVPSRVELVRISREHFREVVEQSESLKTQVDAVVAGYRQRDEQPQTEAFDRTTVRSQSPEFEQLGLIQGQELMLIDLDRCTRCNQCVEACVASHDDGRTRLYLDGPRFEKYLVPLTCRSCLDPVCMIGCPVGSINRGDNGEIRIEDWCIGCSLCADQCPYGSIQMNPLAGDVELSSFQQTILGGADIKTVNERAVVCDLCSSLPSQEPSCVYSCPHDAAMRVSALEFFCES